MRLNYFLLTLILLTFSSCASLRPKKLSPPSARDIPQVDTARLDNSILEIEQLLRNTSSSVERIEILVDSLKFNPVSQ